MSSQNSVISWHRNDKNQPAGLIVEWFTSLHRGYFYVKQPPNKGRMQNLFAIENEPLSFFLLLRCVLLWNQICLWCSDLFRNRELLEMFSALHFHQWNIQEGKTFLYVMLSVERINSYANFSPAQKSIGLCKSVSVFIVRINLNLA